MEIFRMPPMKKICVLIFVWPILFMSANARCAGMPPRTDQAVLDRQFPQSTLSYLLLAVPSGAVLAQRWPDADQPIPIGSLIKPFTAMAWAETLRPFPELICHGTSDACWLPRGHGRMTLQTAITHSCNAYFLALGRDISASDANATLLSYGLPTVNAANKATALAGLSASWQVTPHTLAAAYLKLESDAARASFHPLLQGMRQSAAIGTARAIAQSLPTTPRLRALSSHRTETRKRGKFNRRPPCRPHTNHRER
jgi:hypothetical protein